MDQRGTIPLGTIQTVTLIGTGTVSHLRLFISVLAARRSRQASRKQSRAMALLIVPFGARSAGNGTFDFGTRKV
jgi:hypothetical protein